jgi:benzil reductase ((S)-benzoin forming)
MTHLCIVTGGSRGLGLAMAQQLAARPQHQVLSLARHASPHLPATVEQWAADLADPLPVAERLQRWLEDAGTAAWQSATLINNAGVVSTPAPLARSQAVELSVALRVGLEAALLLSQAFLSATEGLAGPRRLLFVSSGLGRRAMAGSASYCAAKAGMDHLARAIALEEAAAPHGALVCSLAPGVFDTDMQQQLRSADAGLFPERANFQRMKDSGALLAPADAAARVLAWLDRPDFGRNAVADVRDA